MLSNGFKLIDLITNDNFNKLYRIFRNIASATKALCFGPHFPSLSPYVFHILHLLFSALISFPVPFYIPIIYYILIIFYYQLLFEFSMIQHVFNKYPIPLLRVIHQHMCNSTHNSPVLDDGATRHPLHNTACQFQ